MKHLLTYCTSLLLLLFSASAGAQIAADVVHVENNMLVVTIDKRNTEEYKNLMLYFGLNEDSLFTYGNIGQMLLAEKWVLLHLDKHTAQIGKPLSADENKINWGTQPIFFDSSYTAAGMPGYPAPVPYGLNDFKNAPTVSENKKGETVFFVRNHTDAKKVYVSGNFNLWSTSENPMQKTDSGWIAAIILKPGKYLYKFIVDGEWMHDPNNNLKEDDGYGDYNSAYLRYNHTFHLKGYTNAKKVIVSGSFNNWDEKELKMQRTADGWELPLYLGEGTHAYKFIVDGAWLLDPENKTVRADGMGHFNSYTDVGDTTYFILHGYENARLVIVTGTFNNWNTAELQMEKMQNGWKIPYVLAPGNYEYKFIVDGEWITDPDNPYTTGDADHLNSLKVIHPNYTFRLRQYPDAKHISQSGNFNSWAEPGYNMIRKDGVWMLPLYLPAGKYIYKFIVDGQWILDPDNPHVEENEYGTGNSVLWIDPSQERKP